MSIACNRRRMRSVRQSRASSSAARDSWRLPDRRFFEPLEQGERVGGRPGEAGEDRHPRHRRQPADFPRRGF